MAEDVTADAERASWRAIIEGDRDRWDPYCRYFSRGSSSPTLQAEDAVHERFPLEV